MRPATRAGLVAAGLEPGAVDRLVRAALAEDLAEAGDLTSSATVPADAVLDVRWVARDAGVVAGLPVVAAVVDAMADATADLTSVDAFDFETFVDDGARVSPGTVLAALRAPARELLGLERTSLNLLGQLSGVATATRAWVDAIEGTGARVRDTRKTTPLLRALQKYAVRTGGGTNHRAGLHDAVLIKDNHVVAAGGIGAALDAAHAAYPHDVVVQIEVDTTAQLDEAIAHGAAQVLLDNFDVDTLRAAVAHVRDVAPQTVLEASGRLSLERAHDVAATGVDYLAVGALTHSSPVLDIGLDVA